ncbi:DUF1499 domain-containing protein [Jiella mangrovi]|uniref:DUF1499 domain-containing protein n=1 Tax=Jiella mangrovi TaxID=2821407 RepID=A0ABS4BDK4_9HYPH|nr:DUF1499 domain-containing protein [Jiella mangrovi]MBP0614256.1 DUF1499 domain-containing protein [Jiella mangrovi]
MPLFSKDKTTARTAAALAAGVGVALIAGFAIAGPKRIWSWTAGPADQGSVDFATLKRRSAPNDSLACSPGVCREPVDFDLPTYGVSAEALMGRLDRVVEAMGDVRRVDDGRDARYRRYVFRSRILKFPDTLDARAFGVGGGTTALALYSRSLLGRGDFGVNEKRLRAIASALAAPSAVEGSSDRQTGRAVSG